MKWAMSQEQTSQFIAEKLSRIPVCNDFNIDQAWRSPSMNKLITAAVPCEGDEIEFDPNKTTILGGMCLLTTIDMKQIAKKERVFDSVSDFESWIKSWYPRIDQIHDTAGTPPTLCKRLIYVSEDSFFADRISSYTRFPKNDVQRILHNVHEQQGHPTLIQYLRNQGYKGEVDVIYTSDIEEELDLGLRIWERFLGSKFRSCDRNYAKVELMYTGLWPEIINLETSTLIFEAASKMILKGWLRLEDWFNTYNYGEGLNKNLGVIGYLPYITSKGDSSLLSYNDVPNYGNYQTFSISDEDMPWYITNFLYGKRSVVENGPLGIDWVDAKKMIKSDLFQYFNINR